MIFVTTGTHYLPFDRLLHLIRSLVLSQKITEKCVIQSGSSSVIIPNAYQKDYFTFNEMVGYMKKARCIVCHAGPGTIYQALMYGNSTPIVMARQLRFKEHVSNHQVPYARFLKQNKIIQEIGNEIELLRELQNSLSNKRRFILNNTQLTNNLSSYADTILTNQ